MDHEPRQLLDEVLVVEAQDGNGAAWELLFRRWQRRLWRHARRLLGREDTAWDACQDAWMAMLRGLPRLDDPAAFSGWAYRIVTHKCVDRLRVEKRHRDLWHDVAADYPTEDSSGTTHLELKQALGQLSGPMQSVLVLRYVEGFTVNEMAAILDVAEGTVKSRLHRARAELKKLMEDR
ncbi:MAG: RNA polymerase sigma factor [Planctomycetes bacterium]|nr:RNA polymerase sigma factor [Planctomycetota bacterium]